MLKLSPHNLQINVPSKDQLYFDGGGTGGENIQVAVRIRPMLSHEYQRGDAHCIKILDKKNMEISKGYLCSTNQKKWSQEFPIQQSA